LGYVPTIFRSRQLVENAGFETAAARVGLIGVTVNPNLSLEGIQ